MSSCVHDSCPLDGVDLRRRYPGQQCQDLALLSRASLCFVVLRYWTLFPTNGAMTTMAIWKFLWKNCENRWPSIPLATFDRGTLKILCLKIRYTPSYGHVSVKIGKTMRLTSLKIVEPNKSRVSTLAAVQLEARNQWLRFKNDHPELGTFMNDQWGYPKIDGL